MHNNENFKTFYEKAYLLFPIFTPYKSNKHGDNIQP